MKTGIKFYTLCPACGSFEPIYHVGFTMAQCDSCGKYHWAVSVFENLNIL